MGSCFSTANRTALNQTWKTARHKQFDPGMPKNGVSPLPAEG